MKIACTLGAVAVGLMILILGAVNRSPQEAAEASATMNTLHDSLPTEEAEATPEEAPSEEEEVAEEPNAPEAEPPEEEAIVTEQEGPLEETPEQQQKEEPEEEEEPEEPEEHFCDPNAPLQVFIMLGQSNMVGKGSLEHMKKLLLDDDLETRQKYSHLYDQQAQNWTESENVYVSYNRLGDFLFGHLRADGFGENDGRFGPEVEFGFTLERAQCGCDNPILIIKSAFGGMSLVEDFRPPSSGGIIGPSYENALWEVNRAIGMAEQEEYNISGYNQWLGFELKGLVWFQGYNDIFNKEWTDEYRQNLINLIDDLRKSLERPDLPIVVGELGMHGFDSDSPNFKGALAVREAQQQAVDHFGDEVVFVPTAQFMNTKDETYEYEYHYYGRADIVFNIGQAFGNAMLDLIGESSTCGANKLGQV